MSPVIERTLSEARDLINTFCLREYNCTADFSDLSKIDLAYTSRINENTEAIQSVQVIANLQDYSIITIVDGNQVGKIGYNSLKKLIENELTYLDFDALVSDYLE